MEQRIVNPDLRHLDRASGTSAPCPARSTAAPKGGYSSGLAISGTTASPRPTSSTTRPPRASPPRARGGGERHDVVAGRGRRRQPPGPDHRRVRRARRPRHGRLPGRPGRPGRARPAASPRCARADKTQVAVSWTPATPAPGAAAVTGYSVEAIAVTKGANGERSEGSVARAGQPPPRPRSATLAGTENYTVEVRSLTGHEDGRAVHAAAAAAGTGTGTGGGHHPTPTFGRPTARHHRAAADADQRRGQRAVPRHLLHDRRIRPASSPTCRRTRPPCTRRPIPITAPNTTLNFVAFDGRRQLQRHRHRRLVPAGAPRPACPRPTVAGRRAASSWHRSSWTLVSGATKYVVTATPSDTRRPRPSPSRPARPRRRPTVKALAGGTSYNVTVAAANASGTGAASAPIAVTPAVNTVPRVRSARRGRRPGTSAWSAPARRRRHGQRLREQPATPPRRPPIAGMANQPLIAAVAPATGTTFDVRLRDRTAPQAGPGLGSKTSNGGVAGPFTVAERLISCTTRPHPEGPPPTG